MTLAPEISRHARCGTVEGRRLVDRAMGPRPAEATRQLRERFCAGCPIWRECLGDAMVTGEHGPWGGTGRKMRSSAGAPAYGVANMRNVIHPGVGEPTNTAPTAPAERSPSRRAVLLQRLHLEGIDVQHWAIEQGLQPSMIRGLPRLEVVQAYAEAHHLTAA